MFFSDYAPGPGAADFVTSFWLVTVSGEPGRVWQHRVFPDACMMVVFVLPDGATARVAVAGPRVAKLDVPVRAGDRFMGVRFHPDAGGDVLGLSPGNLREQVVSEPLPPGARDVLGVLGAASDASALEMLSDWSIEELGHRYEQDDMVRAALGHIDEHGGTLRVESVARHLDVPLRTLQRRFLARVGLTIKQYQRIRRLRLALTTLLGGPPESWSRVAVERGFADHSHMIREFTALAGVTPGEAESFLTFIEHGRFIP